MTNKAKKSVYICSVILVVVGSEEQSSLDIYIYNLSEFPYIDKSKRQVF